LKFSQKGFTVIEGLNTTAIDNGHACVLRIRILEFSTRKYVGINSGTMHCLKELAVSRMTHGKIKGLTKEEVGTVENRITTLSG